MVNTVKKQDGLFSRMFRRRVSPTSTVGVPGVAVYAGYPQSSELSRELLSPEAKYRTYSEILANRSIAAAGVRYFLNMIATAAWTWSPAEADTTGEYAERLEKILTKDMLTPWHRVVRRAGMYRFYGFSVQEWTARRHEEGYITFLDIAPRAQRTIHRWDVDPTGNVLGAIQQDPQTAADIYIPRTKVLYVVDDSLQDGPEGLGLFRHMVSAAKRLERYEQLEGYGFESDLRGVPVGYAPFTELAIMEGAGDINEADRKRIELPLRDFIEKHIVTPNRGLLLDSDVYRGTGEEGRPISTPKWKLDLLRGGAVSFKENAQAIERLNRELARILGVEQLLLGATSTGSLALSQDKTIAFYQIVESVLADLRDAVDKDIVATIWKLNGWPDEMKPESATEAVAPQDAQAIAQTLRDMATAGAPLTPDDEVINDVRDLSGVSRVDLDEARRIADEDAAMRQAELDSLAGNPQLDPDDPLNPGAAA